jgi:toxin ParE1/3/4
MNLVVFPAAQRDLDTALLWCKLNFGLRVSKRLLNRFDRLGQMLMQEPLLGTPGLGKTRLVPMGRFPYTLVYKLDGDTIQVLALKHQRRKPQT